LSNISTKCIYDLVFHINIFIYFFIDINRKLILLICLNMIFISFVAMDLIYKSCVEIDLASLHYITFMEPIAVFPTEALSFHSDDFTINSMKKVIEGNINDPFVLLKQHFFNVVLL
jgi:hypothetical protein